MGSRQDLLTLIEARKGELGISSDAELARRAGLQRSTVHRLMHALKLGRMQQPPQPTTLGGLARALQLPVGILQQATAVSTGLVPSSETDHPNIDRVGQLMSKADEQTQLLIVGAVDEIVRRTLMEVTSPPKPGSRRRLPPPPQAASGS